MTDPAPVKPAPSRIIPNTFQTPNALVDDEIMSVLTGNEVKCYLFIVRKTFGWHKQSDRIAKPQIMQATGLGESAVDACMESLVRFGLVLRLAENDPRMNHGILWSLQVDDDQIKWQDLNKRLTEKDRKKSALMARLRSRKRGGVDGQPQVDHQGGGGVDHQGTQKTLSKTNLVINAGVIFKIYEEEIGTLTPLISDAIKDASDMYPIDWIPEAISIAVQKNARSWSYVEAILKNCKAAGKRPSLNKLEVKHVKNNRSGSKPAAAAQRQPQQYSAADLAAAERVKRRQQV